MANLYPPSLQLDRTADSANKLDHFGIAGWTSADADVDLFMNGTLLATVHANSSGRYEYQLASWPTFGTHEFLATARDANGNSATSSALSVNLQPEAPAIPTLGSPYSSREGDYVWLRPDYFYLNGSTSPGATVRIQMNDVPILAVRADANGSWDALVPHLNDGIYSFSTTATNNFGTSSSISAWKVRVDGHAPAMPTFWLGNGGKQVFIGDYAEFDGTAEALSTIILSNNGNELGRTNVGADGHWSLRLTLPVGSYQASVIASDKANNHSAATAPLAFSVVPDVDPAASSATQAQLDIGSSIQGLLAQPGDHDWYRVKLDAQTLYQFAFTGAESHAGTLDTTINSVNEPYLRLWEQVAPGEFNQVGQTVVPLGSAPVTIQFNPSHAGDYYLDMGSSYMSGSYTLSASLLVHDDYGDTADSSRALAIGEQLNGKIDYAGDTDLFALSLKAGVTYTVKFDSSETAPDQLYRSLHFLPDTWVETHSYISNGASYITLLPRKDGQYYLRASSSMNDTPAYRIALTQTPDDYSANTSTTGRVLATAPAHGTLEVPGDSDWFKATLTAGQSYLMQAQTSSGVKLQVIFFNADGQPMGMDGSVISGRDAQVWKASATGDYYFQISSFSETGAYTLKVAPATPDDFSADSSTMGRLSTATHASGTLEVPNDADWFKVTLDAGTDYVFRLEKGTPAQNLLTLGRLQLIDASGKVLAQQTNWSGDTITQLVFHASRTDSYYLAVDDPMFARTASYAVSMLANRQDTVAGDASTTATLGPGQVKVGNIDFATDNDWYRVDMQAGHTYNFQLTGSNGRGGTLPSAMMQLKLMDSSGTLVATDYSAPREPTLNYYASRDITLYVSVAQQDNSTGSYTLKSSLDNQSFVDTLPPLFKELGGVDAEQIFERRHSLSVNFDEALRMASGTATLRLASGELVEEFSAAKGNASIATDYPSGTLMLLPTSLAYDTDYVLTLAAGSVTDTSQHVFEGTTVAFHTPVSPARQDGSAANETFRSPAGNQIINGKGGIDTVIMPGTASDYWIHRNADVLMIDGRVQPQGRHTLLGVERVQFDDRTLAFDFDGNAGQAYRIYQAAFARNPDKGGLGFWIKAMDQGVSLADVSSAFVQSDEFKTLYSSASSNRAILEKMYDNVLHRAPDAGGLNWYLNLLDTKVITVAQALADISESAENKAALIGVMQNGFEYTPYG